MPLTVNARTEDADERSVTLRTTPDKCPVCGRSGQPDFIVATIERQFVSAVWGGKPAFERQVEHDRRRLDFCRKKGITLIEIRELNTVTQISGLKQIIKEACVKGGVPLPSDYDQIALDLSPANVKTAEEEMWERILKRASEVNYAVISKGYPGVHGKLRLICNNGHLYTPPTVSFLQGCLCRKCWLNEKRVPVVAFLLLKLPAGLV